VKGGLAKVLEVKGILARVYTVLKGGQVKIHEVKGSLAIVHTVQ
jgi:hypothetical protein